MADRTKPGEQVINLGLSEILSRAEQHVGAAVPSTRSETAVYALTDGELAFEREFVSLAEAKKWGVLVSKAEQTISNQDDIEARLWWIRGHLGALTLPVSLLAAPFETVCRQLRSEDATGMYRNLIIEIAQIMLTRLRDVGDVRQVQRVSETLIAIGLASALGSGSKLEARRERIPPIAPVFSQPTIVEAPPVAEAPELSRPRFARRVLMLCVVAALMVGAYLGRWIWSDGAVSIVSDSFLSQSSALTQEWPLVKAREVSGSLGALYYSLSSDQHADSGAKDSSKSDTHDSGRRSPVVPQKNGRVPEEPVPQRQKEVIKTDGPLEPREVVKPREAAPAAVPQLPAPELALRGDGTGVVQGEERSNFPDGVAASASGVKMVLVRTHVLVNGSHHAKVLAILEPGDRVQVEGTFGRWLRIRSKKGKVGYVFASDVGEVEDFTSSAK